jgi:flagellar basal-body rod protein FlgF
MAVQSADGGEGYTRAGQLQLTADGLLTDARGNPVLGDGGPITVPDATQISIGADGTISVVPKGQGPDTSSVIGKLKLVKPASDQLQLGDDGLMHLAGGVAPADETVTVKAGALESSNVNPSQTLVQMIQLSRQYELQVRAIRTADDNAQSATRLLQVG